MQWKTYVAMSLQGHRSNMNLARSISKYIVSQEEYDN